MDYFITFLVVVVLPALIVGYSFINIEYEYPKNPLKWRAERMKNIEIARVHRISNLEHDLGYLPCSRDDCYSCSREYGVSNPNIFWEIPYPPPPPCDAITGTIRK